MESVRKPREQTTHDINVKSFYTKTEFSKHDGSKSENILRTPSTSRQFLYEPLTVTAKKTVYTFEGVYTIQETHKSTAGLFYTHVRGTVTRRLLMRG